MIVAKRRLQDVARLAGRDSDHWANVPMTLALKPLSDAEIDGFFSLIGCRRGAPGRCGANGGAGRLRRSPCLLDAFGYHAWEHPKQGEVVSVGWVEKECATLAREYFEQISTVLSEAVLSDGTMLSKAVQVFLGPRWDVTAQDVDALRELGVLPSEREGRPCGCSRSFDDHLRVVARGFDFWPPWREKGASRQPFQGVDPPWGAGSDACPPPAVFGHTRILYPHPGRMRQEEQPG